MVQGGMSCIKYIIGIFSFVFVVFSILLIVYGSLSLSSASSFEALVETPDKAAVAAIVIGVILFAIAFLGCCGALRENHCMLLTFSVLLLIIVVVEFIIAGVVYAFKGNVTKMTERAVRKKMCDYSNNQTDSDNAITKLVDETQKNLKCCGSTNYTDWWNCTQFSVKQNLPWSCCKGGDVVDANGTHPTCWPKDAYDEGCSPKVSNLLLDSFGILAGVMLAIALLQLLGIVFSCCLAYSVKKQYEVV